MLRSFQYQKEIVQPFVCFRCLVKQADFSLRNTARRPLARSQTSVLGIGRPRGVRRQFHAGRVTRSSLETQTEISPPLEPPPIPIRERLRQWEIENAPSWTNPALLNDSLQSPPLPGEASNGDLGIVNDDFGGDGPEARGLDEQPVSLDLERFDMLDVGDSRNFLIPGDLVELTSVGNRRQELAIYVRDCEFQAQFYTMSGKWIMRTVNRVDFFVPGFVDPKELESLVPYLPSDVVDSSLEGKLQSFNESIPVEIGQPLKTKMMDFWNKADSIYQRAATDLDAAHKKLADQYKYKYCTLEEIAANVLPQSVPKNAEGKHEWPVLYAVHRSIMKDDIGFAALASSTGVRSTPQYEINGLSEVDCIHQVVKWVREYSDTLLSTGAARGKASARASIFVDFANKARRLIDISRANRSYTPHGTIGPSLITLDPDENFRTGTATDSFNSNDLVFIRFLESWACLRSFGPVSALHGVGSSILRLIDRYPDVRLNPTTAWTCLQELGALPPWEGKAAFELRLPYAGRQEGIIHRLHPQPTPAEGAGRDKLSAIRKDWGDMPIYCVDDAGAHEIDDGFSLEHTDEPDTYWVHVHVADPAARLDPRGSISKFAERVTETVYLPDRVVYMLPPRFTQNNFSLAPGRPCLTFSTKINIQGEVLDSKITAGTVSNVKYLTKETMGEIISGHHSAEYDFYVVGDSEAKLTATRELLQSHEFTNEQRDAMKILHTIGEARKELLRARGGISTGNPRPIISMSFKGFPWTKPRNIRDSLQFFGDPTISVGIRKSTGSLLASDELDTVGCLMILTGEVAARWCSDRGIPLPYRITPRIPNKQDPTEYFVQTLRPAQEQGVASTEMMRHYFGLIGKAQPSTIPGPHVALGLDVFARVTSPLRRFCDLLAHWQIEAALLEEARTGQSLVGTSRVEYLPFSKAQLDEMLPRIVGRERLISIKANQADRKTLIQMVLRAWKFGEAKLPDPLEFTVRSVNPDTRHAGGLVPKLLLGGQLEIPYSIDPADLKVGDRFQVEIKDIDVFRNEVYFEHVQQIESESELVASHQETLSQET